jgi:lysophospholipase L1-like esterase
MPEIRAVALVVLAGVSIALPASAQARAKSTTAGHGAAKHSSQHKRKPTRPKTPATETPNLPVVAGSQYLALGDSVPFGFVEPVAIPAPDYMNPASLIGYPELLASTLHLSVANASCPGETTASFIDDAALNDGCENNPGHTPMNYRAAFPLHETYQGSQLAYAVSYLKRHKNVRLVTLMLGLNDLFVCQQTTADGCSSTTEQQSVTTTIEKNITTILSTMRTKAHYAGQLVIVNDYAHNYASTTETAQLQLVNHARDVPAAAFHATIADGYGAFEKAASAYGGDDCAAALLVTLSVGGCGGHPSYAGQTILAQSVLDVLKLS